MKAAAAPDFPASRLAKTTVAPARANVRAVSSPMPPDDAVITATSDAITVSMLVLGGVALAGAIFAWVVIGRRRTPDHIEMTHATAV